MEAVLGRRAPARRPALQRRRSRRRGPRTSQAAHAALSGADGLDFTGNVEGFAVGTGEADVIVTDGFTGNVFLKVMEGTADTLLRAVREAATSSPRAKAGGLLLRPALGGLRDAIDPEAQGGAFLLGLRRLGVVPHGSFGAHGIARAIDLAARGVRTDVVERTHERLAAARRRCGAPPRDRPRPPLRCPIHDARRGPLLHPRAPGRRARARSRARRGGHAVQGGPRGGLARPLQPRAGARGHLRGQDVRRGGRADHSRSARRSTSCSRTLPSASRGPDPCARCTTCWRGCRTISPGRRSRMPPGRSAARTATSGSRCSATPCSGCRSRRTCSRCWTPSTTAPGG